MEVDDTAVVAVLPLRHGEAGVRSRLPCYASDVVRRGWALERDRAVEVCWGRTRRERRLWRRFIVVILGFR
jgi:hypothetical protein